MTAREETAEAKSERAYRAAMQERPESKLLEAIAAAMETARIAQRMVGHLLNGVLVLIVINLVLLAALIIQAQR